MKKKKSNSILSLFWVCFSVLFVAIFKVKYISFFSSKIKPDLPESPFLYCSDRNFVFSLLYSLLHKVILISKSYILGGELNSLSACCPPRI